METAIDPIHAVTSTDPSRLYAAIAAERSLLWHPGQGLWIAAHPDVVREALESPACRVRPGNEPVPSHLVGTAAGAVFGRFARMTDGDEHLWSRRAIVRALAALDLDEVRAAATRLAARMPAGDLDRYAFDLPVRVMASVLGVPDAELDALASWTRALVGCVHASATRDEIDAGVEAAACLDALVRDLLAAPEPPVELATMVQAFRTEGLSADQAIANVIGLLFQTHDATAGLIGNAIVQGSRQGRAVDEPADAMIERVARQDPSVHNTRRYVARDTSIAGRTVRTGDVILVVLAAAGLVEPNRMWTFGYGSHACPGRSVALTIASAAIESLAGRRAFPTDLPGRIRYCPMANVRIPMFTPACPEEPA